MRELCLVGVLAFFLLQTCATLKKRDARALFGGCPGFLRELYLVGVLAFFRGCPGFLSWWVSWLSLFGGCPGFLSPDFLSLVGVLAFSLAFSLVGVLAFPGFLS